MDLQPPQSAPPMGPPPSVFQSGKLLILIRQGLPLPADRCYKCNSPASVTKHKNLIWHHPSIYLALLGGILLYIILAICLQKKVSVEFGLCQRCNSRRFLWVSIWLVIMFSFFPLMVLAVSLESGWIGLISGIAFLSGAIGALVSARIGWPRKIDEAQIVIAGSGEAFRNVFPKIQL